MTGIPLSKKHGVNPTLMVCEWCGKETGEIGLVGRCSKFRCSDCGATVYGRSGDCPKCGGNKSHLELIERDAEVPRFLPGGLCDECKKKKEDMDQTVREGGVYFRCKNCGSQGAIRSDVPLARWTREKMKIKSPYPCGVEIESCPVCQKVAQG